MSVVTPRSMDDLLEGELLRHYERVGYLPYWAQIWPASVLLARRLLRGPSLRGKRVLDLGCGVGVAGIGARRAGADVVLADLDPDALEFARFNARANRPPDGDPQVVIQRLDWHVETVASQFDLLLLADVSYEQVHHGPLLRHLRQCLVPGGRALQADPLRNDADIFVRLLEQEFVVHIEMTDAWFNGKRLDMRLVTIEAQE